LQARTLDGSAKVSRARYRLTKLFNLGNGIHSNQMNHQWEKATFYDVA
jgi:hypothetical protein